MRIVGTLFYLSFLLSGVVFGQNTLNNLGLTASTPAAVAYSLRQLSSSYSGPAVRVRRSSDGELRDVYFDGGGSISLNSQVSAAGGGAATATLMSAWIGANSGTVNIWYDQSGSGFNASQATTAKQPTLISAGALALQNSRPTLLFSGGQTLQSTANATQITTGGNVTTSNFVYQNTTSNSSVWSNGDPGSNRYNIHAPWSNGNTYFDVGDIGNGGRLYGGLTWTSYAIGTYERNGAQGNVWQNGTNSVSSSSLSTSVTNTANMWVGSYNGSSYYINGALAEMMSFATALSTADRTTLECNQSSYFSIPIASGGFEFYVQNTPAINACTAVEEKVVWQLSNLSDVLASGNNLTKNGPGGWNGGAASWNTVAANGYFQFTASETTSSRMAGLSNAYTSSSYTTIQYAFYLVSNGSLQIYESGAGRGAFGTYNTGDLLKISVEGNEVKYYHNGTVIYTSSVAPTLPLLVDVSINSTNGTITNAMVGNYYSGTFTATTINAGSPSYQWILNGGNVGTNSTTYTNTNLNVNDVVSCNLSYTTACGSLASASSNSMTNQALAITPNLNFFISGNAGISGCNNGVEQVAWQVSSLSGVQATGNNLVKLSSVGGWNGGAASLNSVSNNGYFQFTASETTTNRMAGLSSSYTSSSYTTIQYAFYLQASGLLGIYESGSSKGNFGNYSTGDLLKISVAANGVSYYQNGNLLYISAISPTLPLLADVSINTVNGTVSNALIANPNTGAFTAYASNAGSSPTYQWQVNNANVGTNSTTYTNPNLNNNDVVTCIVTPNLSGCSAANNYTSNAITNQSIVNNTSIDFYIQGTVAASACNTVDEQVKWKISDLVNTQITGTGNSLSKIQNGGWNGGAASWNTVANNGYFQFTATETNTSRMVGLSTTNADANYTSIQYAVYLVNNGQVQIYESGAGRGAFAPNYVANEVFRISVEANVVKYYRDFASGSFTLFYISTITPTLPLLVDVSINSVGGTVTNAIVSNYNTGTFTATATNAGTPSFQWYLNASPVGGATSSTYTNTSLNNNDVVTCTMLPSLRGCTLVSPYTSNSITNKAVPAPTSIDFYVQSSVSTGACQTGTEQVVWQYASLGTNMVRNGNNLKKFQGNNAWDGGGASFNTVSNNGYLQFTATETNTYRMIGLSTTDASSSYTTIQYAIYLQNSGTVGIYESNQSRGNFGPYNAGDIFKVTVESGVVKYYQNGTLLYISGVAPTLPLLVDVSFYSVGSTISNVLVSNPITGTFTATATNAGVSPGYQWKLNGSNVGTGTTTYTNNSLSNNDVVTCVLTPNLGGCTTSIYTSNTVTVSNLPAPANIDFYIQGTVAASACNTVDEQVKWKISDLVNTQITGTGNSLSKIQNGGWNGGAASWNTVANNGYFQFTATETNTSRMVGLSTTNADANYTSIQYAVYLVNNGQVQIYESGAGRGAFAPNYVANEVFRISVEANVVKYYRDFASGSFTLFYISTITPTLPLLVDVSINSVGGTVTNAIVSNYNTGTFTATATNAGTPSFQWYLNASPVGGATSSTYTNTSLNNNDVVTCTMLPSLRGCTLVSPYTSNSITNKAVPAPTSIDFYVAGTISTTACTEAIEQVVWMNSSLVNTQATGNNLLKIQSNGSWNGGAASWNTVSNNGYLQFTATETNTARMAGLSSSYTSSSYTTIQFAFYLQSNGNLGIYESGSSKGNFGSYVTNDVLRISIEANTVKYFQNGILLYISAVAPTLPLLVDASINTVGGTIQNALVVNNSNAGTFTATATNAGVNPTFNWYVNAVSVQTGTSNVYTNTSLVPGDVVKAVLTPNLGGCSLTSYTSNTVTINGPGATPTNWTGSSDTNWYNALNWDNGVPNKFIAANINSGTPNNLTLTSSADVYDLTIQPGATFTIAGANQLFVFRNFTNNGIFVPNTSRVNFTGCSGASTLSSSGTETFYAITVNSNFGLTISSGTHQISNNFTFTNGIVTQNGTLLFLAGSSATGASSTSYVNGPIQKAGNSSFIFPTGNATRFARIAIGIPTAVTTYTAQYFGVPYGSYNNAAAPLPVLNNVSAREYWTLNQTVGAGNAIVTLYWEDSGFSQINNCGTTDLRVARFNGTTWENNNNTVTTTGSCSLASALAGTVSTTAVVTKFGPFTFGSLSNTVNPLPIQLINFQAISKESSVELTWTTASELNNDYFELQRSNQGETYSKIVSVKGAGTTSNTSNYSYDDLTPSSGKNYYRLKQVDFDGTFTFSNVVVAEITSAYFRFNLYPNPASALTSKIIIESGDSTTPVQVSINDTMGNLISMGLIDIQNGNEKLLFSNHQSIASGVYIVTVVQGLNRQSAKLVVVN